MLIRQRDALGSGGDVRALFSCSRQSTTRRASALTNGFDIESLAFSGAVGWCASGVAVWWSVNPRARTLSGAGEVFGLSRGVVMGVYPRARTLSGAKG